MPRVVQVKSRLQREADFQNAEASGHIVNSWTAHLERMVSVVRDILSWCSSGPIDGDHCHRCSPYKVVVSPASP